MCCKGINEVKAYSHGCAVCVNRAEPWVFVFWLVVAVLVASRLSDDEVEQGLDAVFRAVMIAERVADDSCLFASFFRLELE